MAKKMTKTNGANGHRKTAKPPVDDDGFYCIKGELLWKYRAVDSEYNRIQLELKQTTAELQNEISKNEVIRNLYDKRGALTGQSANALKELLAVNEEIEATLGISLKDCAVNDKTGRVFVLNEDGSSDPKGPEKPGKKPRKSQKKTASART